MTSASTMVTFNGRPADAVAAVPTTARGCYLGALAVTYLASGAPNVVNWPDVARIYSGLDTTIRSAIPHRIGASAAAHPTADRRVSPTLRPPVPAARPRVGGVR